MKTVAIIYDVYYNFDTGHPNIGGIESYITNLVDVCCSIGIHPIIYQMGDSDMHVSTDKAEIVQIKSRPGHYRAFVKRVAAYRTVDLAIFATERIVPRGRYFSHSIAVQHGINWDIPRSRSRLLVRFIKSVRDYIITRRIKRVDKIVCVDYNFINWLRAETDCVATPFEVIPNFAQIQPMVEKPSDKICIIFARRLWPHRGTRVFTDAIIPILERHNEVALTIAGDGPDMEYMRKRFERFQNVTFTSYPSERTCQIHAEHHIAVVPTVGSEGTSLSLLEAMSMGCAVVSTYVGGISNIVVDGYNGLLVAPDDASSLSAAVDRLVCDAELRNTLGYNARATVSLGFNRERWVKRWRGLLSDF